MRYAFAKALRNARKAHGLTQEDFSPVSSRTYVSILERGRKSPTLDKMEDIAQTIGIKLLTLMALTHLYRNGDDDLESLLEQVRAEVKKVRRAEADDA